MISLLVIALPVVGAGCQKGAMAGPGDGARRQELADAIHLVLATDREIYTKQVVNRLQNEDKVLKAGEHWKEDKLLPLPAQMFRMGAERVREQSRTLSYALVSLWPINKKNAARTDLEKAGLEAVAGNPNQNHYGTETLAGASYFTAVYPDKAVSAACVDCHNSHPDSPRKDFKVGDVMGAVVIRLK
jgi:hypothetical protein